MSRRTFWIGIALALGAVFLLPAFFVGIFAGVTGLAQGNNELARAGLVMAAVGAVGLGAIWWGVRRSRPRDPLGHAGDSGMPPPRD